VPSMEGKICLITGATSGIGLVAARELARQGARLVLVGRNSAKCEAVTAQIRSETGNPQVEALVADLSSQDHVRELARRFRERHPRLDVLINNAGGMWLQRNLNGEGLEMTFAVNHLAYFLLTHLLLDMLKVSAPSRIVNVSSEAHRNARIDFDDLTGERRYSGWEQYCRSKLMNLLFTYELNRRLHGSGILVNALHPGWVATGFASNNGWRGRAIQLAARWFALTPEQGAQTIVYLASSPDVAGTSGRYFIRERPVASSAASYDEATAKQLWQVSTDLTQPAPVSA
jgi:NAD(P)-dependent dehydrogenase (short-subunit alcohol dehydrogenase family)